MSNDDWVLTHLKRLGLRSTQVRQRIVALLAQSRTPLSPYDIRDQLVAAGQPVDKVSVYRTLELLETHHLVHRVGQQGHYLLCHHQGEVPAPCENDPAAHPLLLCERCGRVDEPQSATLAGLLRDIQQQCGFNTKKVRLELEGLCATCGTG